MPITPSTPPPGTSTTTTSTTLPSYGKGYEVPAYPGAPPGTRGYQSGAGPEYSPMWFNSYGSAVPGPGWTGTWSGLGNPNVTQGNQYIPGVMPRLTEAYNQQNATNNAQLVPYDASTDAMSKWLQSQYEDSLRRLNTQLSSLGIDASDADRLRLLNSGFANEDYGFAMGRIANAEQRDVTLPRKDIAANRDFLNLLGSLLPQTRALNAQSRDNAYGRAQLDYDTQFRNSLSTSSALGSVNSQGLRDTRDEIARQLGLGRGSADIQFGRESIAATKDEGQLKRDQALLDTKAQTLDTLAKDYGIDRQTAESALRRGLAKLGLDFDTTMRKISEASGEAQTQITQLWPMLKQQAMALAGSGGV